MVVINNLGKSYGSINVLTNIDLTIEEGDIFGIVGQSGAGKSTLLRCINGLEKYQEGSVKVLGKEIKDLKQNELNDFRKDLGMIFQNFNLMQRKTVYSNIAFPMEIRKMPKKEIDKRVMELLQLVELVEKKDQFVGNLSGGQKQRVGIARALALNPKILLCDEATSALDPKTTKGVLALLNKINEELGITIIVVTHQMEVIKEICNKTLVLENGYVKGINKTETLFLQDSHILESLFEEDEVLPSSGCNLKIFFNNKNSVKSIIVPMARALDIDISIVWGKLERFRKDVLGSLIINFPEKELKNVEMYLKNEDILWEVL